MNLFKHLDFESVKASSRRFVALYPVEIIECVLFFIMMELSDYSSSSVFINRINYALPYFPIVLCVSFAAGRWLSGKLHLLYYCSIITIVPLLLINMAPFYLHPGYGFGLLLSAFLLLLCKRRHDNRGYAGVCLDTVIDLVKSAFITFVVGAALGAILGTVSYIFKILDNYFEHLLFIEAAFVMPWTFLFLQMLRSDREDSTTVNRFTNVIINYIICPAIIIYTAILYIYCADIAITTTLPLGGVAIMVMVFFIVALIGRMMQEISPKKIYSWYFDNFSYISVPLLALFWVGLIYRIQQYSFTQSRVYLVAAGVMMVLCAVFLLFKKLNNYHLLTLIASAFIIVFTYIPGISARSIGIDAQLSRMNRYIAQLHLLDGRTGKIRANIADITTVKAKRDVYLEFEEAYDYLDKELDGNIKKRYGDYTNISRDIKDDSPTADFYAPRNLPLGDYTYYCGSSANLDFATIVITKNVASASIGSTIVLRHRIDPALFAHCAKLGTQPPAQAFTLRNDSVLVVFSHLEYDVLSHDFDNNADYIIFSRYPLRITPVSSK